MKKVYFRILALVLAAVLLTGCSMGQLEAVREQLLSSDLYGGIIRYEDMGYTRPDLAEVEESLAAACDLAAEGDADEILDAVYAFYDVYDAFYTNYALAEIRYSGDLTDAYWEEEYSFCANATAAVDAALEELNYTLAASPRRAELEEKFFGEEFFLSYEGENSWDAEFTALLEQEAELQNRYYELANQTAEYEYGSDAFYEKGGDEMIGLLVTLIGLRQEIAAYWGYEDYVQFATDFYYYRDYTVSQTESYLEEISRELTPLYQQIFYSERWDEGYAAATEEETYAYVESLAESMGGTVEEAFQLMDQAGLYDISYGANKYNSSFEIYLTSYWEPFIFMNPTGSRYDSLTFAHEFGHFCNDYASYGSYAGVDVTEAFSQGMEYLSLCYAEDGGDLEWVKMADSLCTYVEQAAFASFEMQMYSLEGEELTEENLVSLYAQVAESYGIDYEGYDPREFVTITHYYTNPMYIISYVVSNDAAMQLYQLEQEEAGAGRELFEENLATEAYYFLEFLEEAGLESPFAEGRIQTVRQTFEDVLQ